MLNQVPGVGIEPTNPCGRGILSRVQPEDSAITYAIATPGGCRKVSPFVAIGRVILAPDSATAERIAAEWAWRELGRSPVCERLTLDEWAARDAVPAEEALLPCPFCGGAAVLDNLNGLPRVRCGSRECTAEVFGDRPETARALWNRRAPAVQP